MIKNLIKKYPIIREMFLYGIIGGTSSMIDALLFILLRKAGLHIYLSNFISINVGITISFILNTFFNFKKKDNIKKRAFSFFSIGYVGLLISLLIFYIFVTKMHCNELAVKLFSIVFVAMVQFVLNKLITYGNRDSSSLKDKLTGINKSQVMLYTALELFLILFLPLLISLFGFFININISSFHFIISLFLSMLTVLIISKRKKNIKEGIISTIISLLVLSIAVFITWNLYDYSYDGVNYHLHSVISLMNGWNPIKDVLNTGYHADMNANYFAGKGVWYYSASIAKLFNNINVTKTYILISTVISFLVVYYVMIESKISSKLSNMSNIMISFLIAFNPVITYQFMTNYTDVYMSNLIVILIFSLIYITKKNDNKIINLFAILSIIIMGNIKLTGIFFAFVFCALYFVLWLIDAIKSKNYKQLIQKSLPLVIGGLLIFLLGFNPYFTNIKNGKNMFYPVLGKDKIDLVGENCPQRLQGRNNLKQIYLSIVSPVDNNVDESVYFAKNPLVITPEELNNNAFDIRLSGWGPLFQLITILSVILAVVILILYVNMTDKKKDKNLFLPCFTFIIIVVVALVFPDAWWARYYPILWILPLLLLIMLSYVCNNKKIVSYISIVIMSTMIFNNLILYYSTINNYSYNNKIIHAELDSCRDKKCFINTNKSLFGYTVSEMFKRNNSDIEFVKDDKIQWDYKMPLMSTKVKTNK